MEEFAKLFGKKRGWSYRALKQGFMKHTDKGKRIVIPIGEVIRLAGCSEIGRLIPLKQRKENAGKQNFQNDKAIAVLPPEAKVQATASSTGITDKADWSQKTGFNPLGLTPRQIASDYGSWCDFCDEFACANEFYDDQTVDMRLALMDKNGFFEFLFGEKRMPPADEKEIAEIRLTQIGNGAAV